MFAWHALILLMPVVVLVVGTILLYRLRRRVETEVAPLRSLERGAVALVGAGGITAVPLALAGLVLTAISMGTATSIRVSGLLIGNAEYPPFLRASDALVDAGYESAWVDVANLPGGTRTLLWIEQALPQVTALAIGIAIAWLAVSLLRGAPFTRAFPAVLIVLALVIAGAGVGAQLAGDAALDQTISFLGDARDITAHDDGSGPEQGFARMNVFDPAPLGWGLGIALMAAAFSIGTRLQRETRGLV